MAKLTKEKVTGCLKSSALTLATLAGVIGGVIFGMALRTREGKTLSSKLLFFLLQMHIPSVTLMHIPVKLIYILNKFRVTMFYVSSM